MASAVRTTNEVLQELAELGPLHLERPFSRDGFEQLSARYPDLRMEQEADGSIQIMAPVKFGSGKRESIPMIYLGQWWLQHRKGQTFSASTGIQMPDGSLRSPDCGWISEERLKEVTDEEAYLSVIPDFVVEIRSGTDLMSKLRHKMADIWMPAGVRLGWLINPYQEEAFIYRQDQTEPDYIQGFSDRSLTGESLLPGFELPLDELKV
jgi:Uma2 family endonuclease